MKKNTANDLVKQKKYFDVGFHWYFDRYLSFFWQKRLYFFLFFVALITLLTLLQKNKDILIDSTIKAPTIAYIDNYDEVAFIRKLESSVTEDPNFLIANYLVEKYVISRESYDFSGLEEQKKFIKNNSTSFLYLNFEDYLSISNIGSPLLLYGERERLNVLIKNIVLQADETGVPTKAKVVFDVYRGQELISTKTANIEFYLSDAVVLKKQKSSNFVFTIFRYKVF